MATEKKISSRIIHKHDIEANWNKATNFIPKAGEIIIYDKDENYTYERIKIGDGETKVVDLKFVNQQSDWNQTDSSAIDFIKNKTHYEIPEVATVLQLEEYNENEWRVHYNWESNKPYTLRIDGVVYSFDSMTQGDYHGASGQHIWYLGEKANVHGTNVQVSEWVDYPFSIHGIIISTKPDFSIQFEDGTPNHIVEVIEAEGEIHHLDPKYIKDMYYELQTGWRQINLIDDNWSSRATCKLFSTPIEWSKDNSYQVRVDGVEYEFDGMTLYTNLNIFGSNDLYYIGAEYVPYNPNIDFSQYSFCFVTLDFENIYAVFEDGTLNHTVEFFDSSVIVKQIDSKYLPIATDDDIMDMLAEINIIEPLATSDGSIYTNKNGDIYTL